MVKALLQRCLLEEWQQQQAARHNTSKSLISFQPPYPTNRRRSFSLKLKADDEHRTPGRRPGGRESFWDINYGLERSK